MRILWFHGANENLLVLLLNYFVSVIVAFPDVNRSNIKTSNTLVMKNDHFRGTICQFYTKKQQKNAVGMENKDSELTDSSCQSNS